VFGIEGDLVGRGAVGAVFEALMGEVAARVGAALESYQAGGQGVIEQNLVEVAPGGLEASVGLLGRVYCRVHHTFLLSGW
jgi:hypothetical protein